MSKKRTLFLYVFILAIVLFNIFVVTYVDLGTVYDNKYEVLLNVSSDCADAYSMYYSTSSLFDEDHVKTLLYDKVNKEKVMSYAIEPDYEYIRFDFGSVPANVKVESITMKCMWNSYVFESELLANPIAENDIANIISTDDGVEYITEGQDPYVVLYIDEQQFLKQTEKRMQDLSWVIKIVFCVLIDIIAFLVLKSIKSNDRLLLDIVTNRKLILSLAKNDFKTRFAGSYLGMVWAFVQPVITIVVYWFVFQVGLKSGNMNQYPFIIWLVAGLVPWFLFSEAWAGGTGALIEYNYLVKKVVFKIDILPLVKILSAIFINLFFVGIAVILSSAYGYVPKLYTIQLVYYFVCLVVLSVGLAYLSSAIVVFFRDLSQIIGIFLQVGIWATPIMWDAEATLPPLLQAVFKLNPMYYIVDGYRDAMLKGTWFFDKLIWTIYFWIFAVALFIIGTSVFKKLKVHFADVL